MISRVVLKYRKPGARLDNGRWITYSVDLRANKKRIRRSGFPTKRAAEEFVDRVKERTRNARHGLTTLGPVLVEDLFNKRLSLIDNPKEKTRAKRVFAAFRELSPALVTDVRASHFQKYINSREVKSQTIDREMSVLSAAFRSASQLFPEPLESYDPPRIVRPRYKKLPRQRVITEPELRAILSHILNDRLPREHVTRTKARPVVAAAFELAWLLGLRFGEVKKLTASDFNREARTLRVVRWKTGNVSLLEYLPDRVIEILQNCNNFNFQCSDHTVAKILADACTAAGLTYGRSEIDGITFHSTRHSFTTRLIRVTDLATAKSFTGHSTSEMLGYYGHASSDSKKDAMERMYGGGKDLDEIYRKVRAGKMTLEAFKTALKS